jgi:hypothetical protein
MKSRLLYTMIAVIAAIGLFGCGLGAGATAQPTTAPATVPAISAPVITTSGSSEVTIVSTNSFTDNWGWYYVVGELVNNSNLPVTSIQLSIELKDASGNSLLKDDGGNTVDSLTFSPLLYTLAAGQYSPFEYSFDTSNGTPASFNVTISSQAVGEANRVEMGVENAEMIDDGNGSYYLSGELVNKSAEWVHITSMAGAGLDASHQVLTADWTATYASDLAPTGDANGRDRTPFTVDFPVPGNGQVTQWAAYYDANRTDAPQDYGLKVNLTNNYFDSYGSFHIVGTLTNTSSETLNSLVVGGIFAEDGTTLDATYSYLPIAIAPGASVPFDVSTFSSVNWNAKQASRLSRFTVQADPGGTYPLSGEVVTVTTSNDQVQKDGGIWSFNGNVVNDSGKTLNSETAVVSVYDSGGNLVATGSAYISATDVIASGQTDIYNLTIYLDPNIDASGFTYTTTVQGDVQP